MDERTTNPFSVVAVGQRSETVRRSNLSAIVRELHAHGPRTRSRLVTRTGLTRSTIRTLIGELADAGLVTEERAAPLGKRGRPSSVVRPTADAAVVLALEVAVDSMAAAIVGLGGEVLASFRVDRHRGHTQVDETVADLIELATRVGAWTTWRDSLIGVGVAFAGVIGRDGVVAMAPNLGWRDVPFGDRLMAAVGIQLPLWIGNEADLGALGEARRGIAVGRSHVLFISGEVGVGGGILVNGEPLTGIAGYGGEIGHMPISAAGKPCGCGATGCWETEIGERALLARARRPDDGGRNAIDGVLEDAAAGDVTALAALEATGQWLGRGLSGLVNVLNPELVVLGGLFGRIHPYVADQVQVDLDRHALPTSRRLVTVVPAALGDDAPLVGAAELAFEPLLADPHVWLRRATARSHRASA